MLPVAKGIHIRRRGDELPPVLMTRLFPQLEEPAPIILVRIRVQVSVPHRERGHRHHGTSRDLRTITQRQGRRSPAAHAECAGRVHALRLLQHRVHQPEAEERRLLPFAGLVRAEDLDDLRAQVVREVRVRDEVEHDVRQRGRRRVDGGDGHGQLADDHVVPAALGRRHFVDPLKGVERPLCLLAASGLLLPLLAAPL